MTVPKKKDAPAGDVADTKSFRGLLTPERCRKFVRKRIAERLAAVCDGLLDKAAEGNPTAVKALLQMAALERVDLNEAGPGAPLTSQLAFVRKTLAKLRQEATAAKGREFGEIKE